MGLPLFFCAGGRRKELELHQRKSNSLSKKRHLLNRSRQKNPCASQQVHANVAF